MLVILLVVVWMVALVPIALRKRSDWAFAASMTRFRQANRRLSRSCAHGAPGSAGPAAGDPAAERRRAAERRAEAARLGRLRARRRKVLARMVVGVAGSFLVGCVPALRPLWDLSLVGLLATSAYVALLVRTARSETRPIAQPGPARLPVPPERGGVIVPLRPVRPAFVIVEATS